MELPLDHISMLGFIVGQREEHGLALFIHRVLGRLQIKGAPLLLQTQSLAERLQSGILGRHSGPSHRWAIAARWLLELQCYVETPPIADVFD